MSHFKGPVCRTHGDLTEEMGLNICQVFIHFPLSVDWSVSKITQKLLTRVYCVSAVSYENVSVLQVEDTRL